MPQLTVIVLFVSFSTICMKSIIKDKDHMYRQSVIVSLLCGSSCGLSLHDARCQFEWQADRQSPHAIFTHTFHCYVIICVNLLFAVIFGIAIETADPCEIILIK